MEYINLPSNPLVLEGFLLFPYVHFAKEVWHLYGIISFTTSLNNVLSNITIYSSCCTAWRPLWQQDVAYRTSGPRNALSIAFLIVLEVSLWGMVRGQEVGFSSLLSIKSFHFHNFARSLRGCQIVLNHQILFH